MADTNDVILQGIIVHKFVTPKIAILTINTGSSTPTVNYPKVLFFGDHIKDIEENYRKGNHVKITGNIQSSKYRPEIKNQKTISVFGESIEMTPSMLKEAFGVENGTSYKPFKNEFKLSGKVVRIEALENMVKLVVLTRKNNRPSFVTLVQYVKKPEKVLEKIQVNDNVCAVGCIQTSKKTIKDEVRYFENYVVTDLTA